jgi:two-component system, LytTR family, response regulator
MSSSVEPLRVVVADDEPLARRMLLGLLRTEQGVTVVAECTNGPETIAAVRAHAPDVLFLDVRMPGCSGLEVLEALGPRAVRAVVFVTAFDDYAVAAFDHHALDYVLKPVNDDRFRDTVRRVRERLREQRSARIADDTFLELVHALRPEQPRSEPTFLSRFIVRSSKSVVIVEAADVDWIEADDDYARLHAGARTHLVRETLNALERQLDPKVFVRIHRSAIVRVAHVKELLPGAHGDYVVRLTDGTRLRLSRSYRERLGLALGTTL